MKAITRLERRFEQFVEDMGDVFDDDNFGNDESKEEELPHTSQTVKGLGYRFRNITSCNTMHFEADYKKHHIHIWYTHPEDSLYCRVTAESGCYACDGWTGTMDMLEAILWAVKGAMLE